MGINSDDTKLGCVLLFWVFCILMSISTSILIIIALIKFIAWI